MRLDAFLLADAVSTPPDGKVYIHGGGFTRLTLPVLPFVVPAIGVMIRIEISEKELLKEHDYRLTWLDPAGDKVMPPMEFNGKADDAPPLAEGERRYIIVGVNMGGIPITRAGCYSIEFHIDGELMRSEPVPVVVEQEQVVVPKPPPPNRAARRAQQKGKQR